MNTTLLQFVQQEIGEGQAMLAAADGLYGPRLRQAMQPVPEWRRPIRDWLLFHGREYLAKFDQYEAEALASGKGLSESAALRAVIAALEAMAEELAA